MQPQSSVLPETPALQLPQEKTSHGNAHFMSGYSDGELLWEDSRPLKKRRLRFFQNSPLTSSTFSPHASALPTCDPPGDFIKPKPPLSRNSVNVEIEVRANVAEPSPMERDVTPSSPGTSTGLLELNLEALTYYPPASCHRSPTIDLGTGRIQERPLKNSKIQRVGL